MPRDEYIDEHTRLVNALASGSPSKLMDELVEQRKDLDKALKGGRGRASGFIMRAMAENKKKHTGAYKNPTFPLAPGSTMNKPIEFDWRKLANKSQGGEGEATAKTTWGKKGAYGASPFILHHFSKSPTTTKPDKGEDEGQRVARKSFSSVKVQALANLLPNATTEQVKELASHFGNIGEAPKAPEANQPPSPPANVIEKAPEPPAPVTATVAPKKRVLKMKKKPEPAKAPEPPPKIVWDAKEISNNPLTKGETSNWYDDLDGRQQSLFLFALNNPGAKLASAIEHLKKEGVGKGFSASTISPIYKEMRKEADEVLEDVEKQNKTLTNPAFQGIKAKLDSLLASKKSRPITALKNVVGKGVDVEKYLKAYSDWSEVTGETSDEPAYGVESMLVPHNNEGVRLWHKHGYASKRQFVKFDKVWDTRPMFGGATPPKSADLYYDPAMFDIKDSEGKEVKPSVISGGVNTRKVALTLLSLREDKANGHFTRPVQYINDENFKVSVKGEGFPKGRDFAYKELWDWNMDIELGRLMEKWMNKTAGFSKDWIMDKEDQPKTIRVFKIAYATRIKKILEYRDKPDYVMKIDGHEYIAPNPKMTEGMKYLNKAPEEKPYPTKPSGEEPPKEPSEWTIENANELFGYQTEGDEEKYIDSLTPEEKQVALWYLKNGSEEGASPPSNFQPRWRATEIRKDINALRNRLIKTHQDWVKGNKAYAHHKAKSNKMKGGYRENREHPIDLKDPDKVTVLPIRNKARYDKAREALLQALSNYTVPPVTTRAPVIGKQSSRGNISRGVAFGFGNNYRGFHMFKKNKEHPEVYKALVELGEAIVPKGWDFQTIQLNHNGKCKKHRDKNNVGKSVIIGIGDYKGGELRVWNAEDANPRDYNLKDRPTLFNGALLPHETQPFETGEYERGHGRYTIVYFRHKYKPDSGNIGVGSGKPIELNQPKGEDIEEMMA